MLTTTFTNPATQPPVPDWAVRSDMAWPFTSGALDTTADVTNLLDAIFDAASTYGSRAAWHRCVQQVDYAREVDAAYWEKYLSTLVHNVVEALASHGPKAALESVRSYAECVRVAILDGGDTDSDGGDQMPGPTQFWNNVQMGSACVTQPSDAAAQGSANGTDVQCPQEPISPTVPWR